MKSIIRTLCINKSDSIAELERLNTEYDKVYKAQKHSTNKYDLIRLEKRRHKINFRKYILNKKLK